MLIEEINKLKKEKNAVILAHYYVPFEVQAVADYVGDSYYLSKKVKNIDADLIIFAGVRFMGESAKVLNYNKKVCMVSDEADCFMAHLANVIKINELKKQYDDLAVVCYVNSTLELKKHSDVCVTSSNAVKICKNIPNKNIFFIPDKNLGTYVKKVLPEKNIILNDGYCPVHENVLVDHIRKAKNTYPNAKVLGHPELNQEAVKECDFLGSTSMIIDAVKDYPNTDEFIVLTERGILYVLRELYPDKKFIELEEQMCCHDMKMNTLEKLLEVLKFETNEIVISESDMELALKPLEEMLRYAK